jgi:hypothetical protein
MTEPKVSDDPIWQHNERQDEYWRRVGRDESTYQAGFSERWELMLERERER